MWLKISFIFVLILGLNVFAQQEMSSEQLAGIDSTGYSNSLNAQDLGDLPFRGEPHEYYSLLQGVISQDYRGEQLLHVRGSRHDEIAYGFNGVDVRSAFTGLNVITFIPEATYRLV